MKVLSLSPLCVAVLGEHSRDRHPLVAVGHWYPCVPRAGRARRQPYLLESEAMGLGMGLVFVGCFTTEAWQS